MPSIPPNWCRPDVVIRPTPAAETRPRRRPHTARVHARVIHVDRAADIDARRARAPGCSASELAPDRQNGGRRVHVAHQLASHRRCPAAGRRAAPSRACAPVRRFRRAVSSSGSAVAPSSHDSPPSKCSCFQMGTICFTRSIVYRHAANAVAAVRRGHDNHDARLADLQPADAVVQRQPLLGPALAGLVARCARSARNGQRLVGLVFQEPHAAAQVLAAHQADETRNRRRRHAAASATAAVSRRRRPAGPCRVPGCRRPSGEYSFRRRRDRKRCRRLAEPSPSLAEPISSSASYGPAPVPRRQNAHRPVPVPERRCVSGWRPPRSLGLRHSVCEDRAAARAARPSRRRTCSRCRGCSRWRPAR